jgi:hypothetical protein
MAFPTSTKYLSIGAGIHGLSTAQGYKMIGVGQLVAEDICGRTSDLLEPFRFSRFAEGKLHPTSNSPFPWS